MRGVVAAGNLETARAAASTLREGGNAVDAVIAGALVAFTTEPLLISAGGAGIMLVREPGEAPVAVDFFSPAPGSGPRPRQVDFHAVEVDFGSATQVFHVGRASAAVPMMLDGLALAADRFGRLSLERLVGPALGLAREGVVLDRVTVRTFDLLWPILRRDPGCVAEIAEGLSGERPPRVGERLRNSRLAATLERFGQLGRTPPELIEGLLAQFGPEAGGVLDPADLERAKPRVCEPHLVRIGEWELATSPRLGGRLVGMICRDLSAGALAAGEAGEAVREARASLSGHRARIALPANLHGSTTHISVVDEHGGAASMTATTGEGSGHVVTGTGVHVNNFLGEEDLNPAGFHLHRAGDVLPTMIAPTLALDGRGRVLALGSGGSNRIRSAVAQVLHGILRRRLSVEAAVRAPRVHAEDHAVWVELEDRREPHSLQRALEREFPAVHPFSARDFFFGGVHVAGRTATGRLEAAGDPRRGGAVEFS